MGEIKKIGVIGGGAAGFFAASSAAVHHPSAHIDLFEKTSNVLAKVKVSGGGRCNVTHACTDISTLIKAYPRGGKGLKSIFYQFDPIATIEWFNQRGVELKTEDDGRMFPVTDSSQTIIDCLVNEIEQHKVTLHTQTSILSLYPEGNQWVVETSKEDTFRFDRIIVATGGSPKLKGFAWLNAINHTIIPPVPSLFTFNMPNEKIKELMGVVVEDATVKIEGTPIKTNGPLLITHWGMSGPAILKASSFGARLLAEKEYQFTIRVQWIQQTKADVILSQLLNTADAIPQKLIHKNNPLNLPNRLWSFLIDKLGIPSNRRWNEVGKKNFNRLVELLLNDRYSVAGKTTFKEEFVTCGGISLEEVNLKTMESKVAKGLYFAGEIIDVDAVTGGYNFQAAWSGGFVAGKLG